MNKLLFLAPLAITILVLVGMSSFGNGGLDWLITDSVVIITAAIFVSNFINFYKKYQNALDLAFAILFSTIVAVFVIGVILSDTYFWLFVNVYLIIVNVLGAVRFFVVTRRD